MFSQGIRFFLVELPDVAVKVSQQRIESAFRSSGFKWPGKQVVINMAPVDIRKEGSSYDLPEFKRSVLEVMRQPLEDRVITISRAKSTVDYPASFMLVVLIAYLF